MKKVKLLLLSLSMVGLLAGSVLANVYTFDIPTTVSIANGTTQTWNNVFGVLGAQEYVTGASLSILGNVTGSNPSDSSNFNQWFDITAFADQSASSVNLRTALLSQDGFLNFNLPLTNSTKLLALNGLMHSGSISFALSPINGNFSTTEGGNFKVTTAVPEPGTMSLLGMGLLGMIGFIKRKFVA